MEAKRSSTTNGKTARPLEVVYRLIVELVLNSRNPRTHSKKQISKLADSIRTFDFIIPIVIDARGRVICGHGRLLAAQVLGLREVPTIMIEHLSEAQAN